MSLVIDRTPIFAVVWIDFIPLSLPCKDQADAIETANAINHRRALIDDAIPHACRARPLLLEADDTIVWLDGGTDG